MLNIKTPLSDEIDFDSLPEHARKYLAEYGARQSLHDSIAGMRKEFTDAGETDEDVISAALKDEMKARWESILDGTIGTRAGGPRLRGIDTFIRDIAVEEIKASAAKLGKKLPKGEDFTKLRDAYIKKHGDRLHPIAQERMDTVAENTDEAADLLEGLLD